MEHEGVRAEILSTYQDLLRLKKDWKELYAETGGDNVFLSWEWNEAYCRTFLRRANLLILAFERQGRIAAIAPLVRRDTVVSFLSDPDLADYQDVLVRDAHAEVFRKLLEVLSHLGSWDHLRLARVRHDSANLPHLERALEDCRARWHRRLDSMSPYVALDDLDGYFEALPAALKRDIRYAQKKLTSGGGWTFVRAEAGTEAGRAILERLFDFHRRRPRTSHNASFFTPPDNRAFFIDIFEHYGKALGMDLSALKKGDAVVSAALGLSSGMRYYHWFNAVDPAYRKFPLEALHLRELMEDVGRKGTRLFDFMPGRERNAAAWTTLKIASYDLRVFRHASNLYLDRAWCAADSLLRAISPAHRAKRGKRLFT
jgi:CelD/BcsL family acetyltransferase involved in cellulose biosynthesis